MATYVLVGGAWLGAWAWTDVANRLRARGHDVRPISLTGLGERVAEAAPETDLETHIADIVGEIERNDLHDVILVGHSYSGVPITGAADRVRERIRLLVYVDCAPIPNGMSLFETCSPEEQAFLTQRVKEQGDGWRFPLPAWDELAQRMGASLTGISDEDLRTFRAQAVPHPFGTYRQALRLTGPEAEPLPKLGVLCSFPEAALREMIAAGHPWARSVSGPEWQFVELLTGHWPMFSESARLADLLAGVGEG